MAEAIKRKLTTILAADAVGYSRLMACDEEAALKTLRAYREVVDDLIARHNGRIFNTAGDAVLAEFVSAVEAVRCAIAIQEELAARNALLSAERRMSLRIGVNVGDVMIEGENLFGDGVNVAARLEGIAEPGGVCISGSTFEQVKNKLSIGFEDIGAQEVKNIPYPVAAYRLCSGSVSVIANAPEASRHASAKPSSAPRRQAHLLLAGGGFTLALMAAAVGLGRFYYQEPVPLTAFPELTVEQRPQNLRKVKKPEQVKRTDDLRPRLGIKTKDDHENRKDKEIASRTSTDSMRAEEIVSFVTGMTIQGLRTSDGQPFTINLHTDGTAYYEFGQTGELKGTVHHETGRWRAEDFTFCMQFQRFNYGREACPRIVKEGSKVYATRLNGAPLEWTFSKE